MQLRPYGASLLIATACLYARALSAQPYAAPPAYPPQPYAPPAYPPQPYAPPAYPPQPYAPPAYPPQPYAPPAAYPPPPPSYPPQPYAPPPSAASGYGASGMPPQGGQPYPTPPYGAWPTPRVDDSASAQPQGAATRRRRRRAPPTPEPSDPGEHALSLTVSLLHPLLFAIYDAALELRLGRNVGVAAVAGFGSIGLRQFDWRLPDQDAKLLELGGQLRTYPVGSFDHGMLLGFELMYLHGSADAEGTIELAEAPGMTFAGTFTASGSGYRVGPFVGYKLALPVGLTIVLQAGFEYASISATATDSIGHSASAVSKGLLPLADVSVGWSF